MTFGVRAEDNVNDDVDYHDDVDYRDDAGQPGRSGFDLRSGGTDLFRAVLILLLAAAIGTLILTRGVGNPDGVDTGADESATEEDGDATTGDPTTDDPAAPATDAVADDGTGTTDDSAMTDDGATTTETTAPLDNTTVTTTDSGLNIGDGSVARDPKEVEVLVLNATDRKGIAAQASELLGISSYNTAPAGNATQPGMGSVIYYMEGYRADALAVAEVFTDGLEGLVQPYDATNPPADDIGSANVIVILGVDDAIPIG